MDANTASWDIAKSHAAVLGPPNPLLCGVVRAVTNAPSILKTTDQARLRTFAQQSAFFPVKVSPTFTTSFLFAAREYYPAQVLAARPITRTSLLALFEADELLAILSTTYFCRRVRKKLPEATWNDHLNKLLVHIFLGGLVGRNMKGIGLGHGILLGALNYVSLLAQAATMPRAFDDFNTAIAGTPRIFDLSHEIELLSCSHHHVAHVLATSVGFDPRIRAAFGLLGPDEKKKGKTAPEGEKPEDAATWQAVLAIASELHESGTISVGNYPGLLERAALESILRTAATVRANPDQLTAWFLKKPSDLPADIREELKISTDTNDDDE